MSILHHSLRSQRLVATSGARVAYTKLDDCMVETVDTATSPSRVTRLGNLPGAVRSLYIASPVDETCDDLPLLAISCQESTSGFSVLIVDTSTDQVSRIETPQSCDSSFGSDVAISRGKLLVTEPTGSTDLKYTGKVLLIDPESGSLIGEIKGNPGGSFELFGASIAESGDLVAIGSPLQNQPLEACGGVHIYRWVAGILEHEVTLTSTEPVPFSGFGSSVLFDGELLLVGVPGFDGRGSVEAFAHCNGGWELQHKITDTNGIADRFGSNIQRVFDQILIGEKEGDHFLTLPTQAAESDNSRFRESNHKLIRTIQEQFSTTPCHSTLDNRMNLNHAKE